MDGKRWAAKLLAAGAVAAAVGCSGPQKTTSGMPAQLPGQGESRWARVFGPPKPPGPIAPPPEVSAQAPRPTKKGVKPETDVTFAKVQVDAAFLESQGSRETDQLLDAARTRYQKVLATDPKNAEALRGLGELYTRAGDRERAFAAYQSLVQAYPKDHKAAHEMALACARFDEWGAAAQACEYALSLDPENRRYHKTYGKCLIWSGQYDKGYESLAKVLPEAEARYTLGKVLVEADQVTLGRQQMQLAVQADPTFAPAKDAIAKLDAGRPLTGGDVQQAGHAEPAGGN